ncbi:hypothetical protein [Amycolatopsis sp. NPDC059657]|uniref:nuclease-related domain-containing protein n=1 Tax=Amycolatopsis sp. NPDC059657 TaxID=3346899 RepID=UPI00366D6C7E
MVSRGRPGDQVRRWRRGRAERLYVTGSDGRALGYLDVKTGLSHQVPAPRRAEFEALVDAFLKPRPAHPRHEGQVDTPTTTPGKPPPLEALPAGTGELDLDTPAEPSPRTAGTWTPLPVTPGTLVPGTDDGPGIPLQSPPSAATPTAATNPPLPQPRRKPQTTHLDLADNEAGARARSTARSIDARRPIRASLARLFSRDSAATAARNHARAEAGVSRKLGQFARPWWSRLRAPHRPWYVLHDVPLGTAGVTADHLVIGPAGVFTMAAVGRHVARTSEVSSARKAAEYARRCLTPYYPRERTLPVVPLVVLASDREVGDFLTDDGVRVIGLPALTRWLRARGPILAPGDVEQLYQAARSPATWASPDSA